MGTGYFLGVKRPGRATDHQPPSKAKVKERVYLYLYPIWAFVFCSRVRFTFFICSLYVRTMQEEDIGEVAYKYNIYYIQKVHFSLMIFSIHNTFTNMFRPAIRPSSE